MENYKRQLIELHILPFFDKQLTGSREFRERLFNSCRLHNAIKLQQLETPGNYAEGRLWFSINAMVHAYFYCLKKNYTCGTRIWKKNTFIFYGSSLLDLEPRTDYIQVLEPGTLLSIGYIAMQQLMVDYPELKRKLLLLSELNGRYYQYRNALLNQPPLERALLLKKQNPGFIACTSQSIQAAHLKMSLRSYVSILKLLKNQA